MAGFDVTVDGAYKGKPEDVANMKRRLSELLDNQDKLDDADWLRELFGDEIDEIDGLDLDDEDSISEYFNGFNIDWGGNRFRYEGTVDTANLCFAGSPAERHNQTGGEEVSAFLGSIKNVFPRVDFHFISWCYISWGHYLIFLEDEEDVEEHGWDESDNGEEKKDAYVAWRLAYRDWWLLGDDAPAAKREAAKKAEEEAEAVFERFIFFDDADREISSEEEALEAVQNGLSLKYVPEAQKTEAICLAAVQQDGYTLQYVPEAQKTEALCLAAVQQSGSALRYVPEALKTEAICIAAVQKSSWMLQYVPDAQKTEAMCLAAVQESGGNLEYVPDSLKTEAICLTAVQQSSYAIKYVPEALNTEPICIAAVQDSGGNLEYVPEALKTEAVCLAAVQNNGNALQYVPETLKTETICLAAVQDSGKTS